MTRVSNIKYAIYDVYIGRANSYYGLASSKFNNPFVMGKDGTRYKVLEKYEQYLDEHPELIDAAVKELDGKILGCWCDPLPCHGNVLIKKINKRKEELKNEAHGSLSLN